MRHTRGGKEGLLRGIKWQRHSPKPLVVKELRGIRSAVGVEHKHLLKKINGEVVTKLCKPLLYHPHSVNGRDRFEVWEGFHSWPGGVLRRSAQVKDFGELLNLPVLVIIKGRLEQGLFFVELGHDAAHSPNVNF